MALVMAQLFFFLRASTGLIFGQVALLEITNINKQYSTAHISSNFADGPGYTGWYVMIFGTLQELKGGKFCKNLGSTHHQNSSSKSEV